MQLNPPPNGSDPPKPASEWWMVGEECAPFKGFQSSVCSTNSRTLQFHVSNTYDAVERETTLTRLLQRRGVAGRTHLAAGLKAPNGSSRI